MRTRQQHRTMVLGTVGMLMIAATVAFAGDPGSAGVLSMRLGVGARAGAMGETGVAAVHDGSAIYWNPANMAHGSGTQITLQHMEYFDGLFRKESVALSHDVGTWSFGMLFSGFYSDELQRTSDDPAGAVQGTFQPYDLVLGVGTAYEARDFAVGATVKMVYERIDLYDGIQAAFDVGVQHRARIEGLSLGASIQNLGGQMTLNEVPFDLPLAFRLGAAYSPVAWSMPSGQPRVTVSTEIVSPNDGNSRLHAGGEVWLHDSFAVRGGNRFQYDTWGATFGAGFRRGTVTVDYAYLANRENTFDGTHRFSLTLAYLD